MSSKSANSFFSILVPLSALFVTITLVLQQTNFLSRAKTPRISTVTYSLQKGHNSIAPPFDTSITIQNVCDDLAVESLTVWRNDKSPVGPRQYDCTDDLLSQTEANVKLSPTTAVIFELTQAREWSLEGTPVKPHYAVSEPGVYLWGYTNDRSLYANALCDKHSDKEYEVQQVYSLQADGEWLTHDCENAADNNFQIKKGVGYALLLHDKNSQNQESSDIKTLLQ